MAGNTKAGEVFLLSRLVVDLPKPSGADPQNVRLCSSPELQGCGLLPRTLGRHPQTLRDRQGAEHSGQMGLISTQPLYGLGQGSPFTKPPFPEV